MKFVNYPIVYFAILLGLGIVTAHFFTLNISFCIPVLLALIVLLTVMWFSSRNQLFQNTSFGVTAFVCIFVIGFANYQIRLPKFQKDHYSNFLANQESELIQVKVIEVLKADRYYTKYIVDVQAIDGTRTSGNLLFRLRKDSLDQNFSIDDIILTSGLPEAFNESLNPFQFNFAKYMRTLNVYDELHISNEQLLKHTSGRPTLRGWAGKIRNKLLHKLKNSSLGKDERAIIQALVLGDKRDISTELYKDYAAAGAVHILAISGLHIGLLFLIFSTLLKPIKRIAYGNYLYPFILLIFLWCFALLAGLSASVTRAVTMFSFFVFANSINRETNTINTLFLSFFVLLIINPLWIFHVGFQLSYLAVLSILLIRPKLSLYYRPRFYLDKLLWDVFTVSIAAQVGIVPLSLYYFHQFPGLFFITNLVVLPLLGLILGGSLLFVLLSGLNLLPEKLTWIFNFLIGQLNNFISWIARQEQFLFEDIPFSEGKVVGCYLIILALFLLWKKANFKRTLFVAVSFCLLIVIFLKDSLLASKNQLVVFHRNKMTIVAYKQARNLKIFRSDSVQCFENIYPVKDYRTAHIIENYSEENIPSIFKYRDQIFLVIDSMGVYPKELKKPIVLLTFSPKVHLERLLDSLEPKLIIADGSNYLTYVSRWQRTCEKKKLPFHHTGTKGAFIIE
jgi:competence protein ComEC